MQLLNQDNIEKRMLYYISRMYAQNLKKGNEYNNLNKCVGIVFANFELKKLENIEKYMTKWNIREKDYPKIVLTDIMELYIIEMTKVEKYAKNSRLDNWVKYIIGSEDLDMEKVDEDIKEAQKVLEDISNDEYEQYLADLREKYILDMNNIESTGIRKGREEGAKQSTIEIAKKLKSKEVDINIIKECTGLSIEQINKL